MRWLLNKVLDLLQPQKIFPMSFLQHVVRHEVEGAKVDPSNRKVVEESFLQFFIQITEARKKRSDNDRHQEVNKGSRR
jgi:hypothetical protein